MHGLPVVCVRLPWREGGGQPSGSPPVAVSWQRTQHLRVTINVYLLALLGAFDNLLSIKS